MFCFFLRLGSARLRFDFLVDVNFLSHSATQSIFDTRRAQTIDPGQFQAFLKLRKFPASAEITQYSHRLHGEDEISQKGTRPLAGQDGFDSHQTYAILPDVDDLG